MRNLFVTAILLALLVSCSSSTEIVASWRDPGTTVEQGQYKKILCIALVQDETNRRVAEDKLVSLMQGNAVQSYTFLGNLPDTLDQARTVPYLIDSGFDGILIMRLARREKDVSYSGGSYPGSYYSMGGYYGYAMPYYNDPGYMRTDDYYYIETNIYDIAKDKLIWSGMTSSWEPSNVPSVVEEVAVAVKRKMQEEGFLAAPPVEKK